VDAIRHALSQVIDPELGDNVVDLGMVRTVERSDDGRVGVTLALTTAGCPLRAQLMRDVRDRVGAVPGVTGVDVHFGEMTAEQKRNLMERARWKAQQRASVETDIPPTTRVLAVASGKGGVGKSSVTANLATRLAMEGLTVGVLDADIGGFSIPRLLGVEGRVQAQDGKMVPLERSVGTGLLKVLSMGSIEGTEEDQAVMLRGLMLNRAVQHFLEDVRWGPLDYLLIDMPPGTGDIQMGLARMLPRAEVLLVTTPAPNVANVAARTADMARKGYLRVAGVVENMSGFVCDHGTAYALFGQGGGEQLAARIGVPLLAQIPLDKDGPSPEAFGDLAKRLLDDAVPTADMASCSARLLSTVLGTEDRT
jgi:ATP-binding protein involved in chromosome partitioning